MPTNSSPLLVVLGPTGTGKSALGLSLAQTFHGEIVSCDSVQVYRGLDIGSGKVPLAARRAIPHHLTDILDPNQELTAGAYSRLAREVFETLRSHHVLPIVVGGTGFYLRALLDGLSPSPRRDPRLRERLGRLALRRPAALHRFVTRFDPQAAARIHPNDHQKLIRAIELTLIGGESATAIQSQPRDALAGYKILKLGLAPARASLYERLNRRVSRMFDDGLIRETQRVLAAGFPASAKPLQALGYKQAVDVITESRDIRRAIEECQTKTRQYAKRQCSWFRAERDVTWLEGFGDEPVIQARAAELTRDLLATDLPAK